MDDLLPDDPTQEVLLVGVDAARISEFSAAAAGAGNAWRVSSAKSAAEAFAYLQKEPVGVVVTPVWLADTSGVDFLDNVMAHWPDTARVLLSDSTLIETAVRGLGKAHHHLLEPSDSQTLLGLFKRISAFRSSLSNPKLATLMARMPQLPSPPEIYFRVLEEVRSNEGSVEEVGKLIMQDAPLSAKVLQLANSAVFGLQLQVIHPVEAVTYLGLETTKALLLLAHTFSFFDQMDCPRFSLASLQYHAMTVGRYAERIAELESASPEIQSESFTAGLLHDLGKLFLAANLPQEFALALTQSQRQSRSLSEVETELLGATHAEVGGFVLDTWHLPDPIVEAVTWHHYPRNNRLLERSFSPLTAVHAANALEHDIRREPEAARVTAVDMVFLKELGLAERWAEWCSNAASSK